MKKIFIIIDRHSGHFGRLSASTYMNAPQSWYVYMLLCDGKTFYVGISDDILKRFIDHNNKQSFYTRKFLHLELAYCERYETKYEAAKREQQLKGWSHAKKQMLIDGKLGINTCTEYAEELIREVNM